MLRVRSASGRDCGRLLQLLDELGYPSTDERLGGALEGAQTNTGDVLVAEEDDGRLVGFASYQLVYFFEDAAPRCRLTAIVVDSADRRAGAGTLLLREVERIAVEAGCTAIEATSNRTAERGGAHRFYRDFGFVDGASKSASSRSRCATPENYVGRPLHGLDVAATKRLPRGPSDQLPIRLARLIGTLGI